MGGKHPTGEYNTWKEKQIFKKIKNEGVAKKKISGSHLVIPALCRNNRLGMLAKL